MYGWRGPERWRHVFGEKPGNADVCCFADGGGIPLLATNPSILYPLSIHYDSSVASLPFSANLAIFDENKPKWLSMS
jgi:hypothetical protein